MKKSLKREDFKHWGSWVNGTYFNSFALVIDGQSENYQRAFGLDHSFSSLLNVADEFFCLQHDYDHLCDLIRGDPHHFLRVWSEGCQNAGAHVREYVDAQVGTEYRSYSDADLLSAVKEFHAAVRELYLYLFSYLPVADVAEAYVIDQIPDVSFNEVRPLHRISAEVINDELLAVAEGDTAGLERLREKYAWYGLNLLRGQPLSLEDIRSLREQAKPSPSITSSENELLRDLQLFVWLKFDRIDAHNYALYGIRELFYEAMRRLRLSSDDWELFLFQEIEQALVDKTVPKNLAERRTHRGIISNDGVERHLTTDEYVHYKKTFVDASVKASDILKGTPASPGHVTGHVKVMRAPDEITKVKPGDILVTAETIVQHEPYMRHTKAMVVEMGGMLSHSAIFSREFKIPTVVGVQNATKILNDGDEVEVDAEEGVVRILKHHDN